MPVRNEEDEEGFLTVDVELTDPKPPTCSCDMPQVYKHGRRVVHFRDHPIQRTPVRLRLTRQRYRCISCGSILLEEVPGIDPDRDMTIRFREQIAKDAVRRTFADAALLNGVDEALVRRIFKAHAAERMKGYRFELPRVLGMDEKNIQGRLRFVIGNIETKAMLDMQPSRTKMDLEKYFDSIPGRDRVEVVTQDMYRGYKDINKKFFKKAIVVIDKFHVVRYANIAVETVRKAIQSSLDNEGRIKMKRKIRLLAARPERLGEEGKAALSALFEQHPILDQASTFKEWFFDIYQCQTRREAEAAYAAWRELLPKELEGPFGPILSFMRDSRWRPFIFNYFDHPYTNAYIEALNGLIDQINRAGRGYDLETLRAKAILRYGDLQTPNYDLMSVDPADWDELLRIGVSHGVDLSTFESAVKREAFW